MYEAGPQNKSLTVDQKGEETQNVPIKGECNITESEVKEHKYDDEF
jgi:hypothetical protein